MWDAVVWIVLCNTNWWIHFRYLAISGFPLTFSVFFVLWQLSLFPSSMYRWNTTINLCDVVYMLVMTDVLQTLCHRAAHTYLRHTFIGKSHMVHHVHRDPQPHDAFYTGICDAILQVVLPLYIVLLFIQPSRYSAILFGSIYSWWLLFIHSDPKKEYPWLEYFHLVTPRNHHKHHRIPSTNFSNIFHM